MIEIFFDGECIVCSTEILYYKKIDSGNHLKIVNIKDPNFIAQNYNLNSDQINLFMHIRIEGVIYTKVDAFKKIWEVLPGFRYKVLVWLTKQPLSYKIMNCFYILFATYIRPILPKRKF